MRKIYSILSVCLFSLLAYNSNGQDCDYGQSSLLFDLDECQAIFGFPSQTEYDEFTAIPDTFPGGTILSVVGDHLYREDGTLNMHSCTESYDTTAAMCVGSLESCDYVADSDKAVRFDIKVELGNDGVGRLSGLSFHEAAPEMFSWLNGSTGPNNYPTKYAVRVSVNGSTVFEQIDIETSNDWTEETFDFSDIAAFRVTAMTVFNFELLPYCPVGIDSPVNAWDLENIIVTANAVDNVSGGDLTFGDSTTEKDICVGDGNPDNMNVNLTGTSGATSKYLITDAAGVIIAYDVTFPFDFEGAGDGTCLIWNITYIESIEGTDIGANAADITGCFDLSNSISLIRNEVGGGTLTGGPFEFCAGDGVPDNIDAGAISLVDNVGANGTWVITDDQGVILGLPANYADVDFDGAGSGTCLVWYLSFEDGLTGATMGANAADLEGCFDLSNPISVIRNERPEVSISPSSTICGEDNGSASASGSNGASPYTYFWSNGQAGSTITDLAPGDYTVIITDANGCTNSESTTVDDSESPSVSAASNDTTCGDNNGSAIASSTAGTAPYTFAWSNGASGSTINGLSEGEYTVTVTDANGCTDTSTTTINASTSPEVSVSGDNTSCGEDNGTAAATTSGGQTPYTYIWTTGSTNASISGLAAGNYRVTVTDASGCTDWADIDIEDSSNPSASTNPTDTSCGEDNGAASASATSGVAPYTYAWSNGSSDQNLSALVAGSYTVTVTDSEGCTSTSTAVIDDSSSPNVSTSTTSTSCGEDNGSATATATSGTTPYTYAWSNGSTGAMISNLSSGAYSVTVTDAAGCTATSTTTVDNSSNNSASAASTDTSCGEDNGTAMASGTGGTAPYTYAWSNGSTSAAIAGLDAGSYTVTITDAAGCTASANTTVDDSSSPTASTSSMATTCGEDNGTATVTVTGGISPYTYLWSNDETVAGGSCGDCIQTVLVPVGGSDPIIVEEVIVDGAVLVLPNYPYNLQDPVQAQQFLLDCLELGYDVEEDFDPATGIVAISVLYAGQEFESFNINGGEEFNFTCSDCLVQNGSTNASITGLAAGSYTVTVTDSEGCTSTSTITVGDSSSPDVSTSTTSTSCGEDNGSATAAATSGTAPYTYAWSNGSTGAMLSNLSSGAFTVTVTDAAGCSATSIATVDNSSNNSASATSTNTSCGEDNGSALASATGGTAPYTYAWSDGGTSAAITGLAAGTYTVTITDAAGCTASANTTVDDSSSPTANTSSMATTCGEDNGTVTVTATGGVAPYTYLWSNDETVAGGSCGDCIQTVLVPVGGSDPIIVEEVIVDGAVLVLPNYPYNLQDPVQAQQFLLDCLELGYDVEEDFDPATGIVAISVLYAGQEFESFNINGGEEFNFTCSDCLVPNGSTNASITGLAAGSYTVTVTDANGCTAESSVTVDDSSSPTATASGSGTTCGDENGNVSVTATSGIAPYTYAWSNGSFDAMQSSLAAGTYTVTVTDAAGCTGTATTTVVESNPISANASSTDTSCEEDNGTASVEGANGTAPYTYLWFNGSTSSSVSGLIAGTYSVTVTDAVGCTAVGSTSVEDSSSPTSAATSTDTTCGEDNGSASASATGGTGPYTYAWSNGSTGQNISNLSAGTYAVTITDAEGCTSQASASVSESTNVDADASATETTCAMNNGMATVDAVNGTAPYTYLWSTAATTQMIMGLEPGDYMVTVTDANGCTDAASVLVEDSAMPSAVAVPTPTQCGEDTGTVSASVFGGVEPYTYEWSNGSTENMIAGLAAGSYSVTVTDDAGCTVTRSTTVEDSSSPMVSINKEDSTCGEENGSVSSTVTSGAAPYTYAWSNGATSANQDNLGAGTYSLTVTDASGCTSESSATIDDSNAPMSSASATPTTCGENNGSATVSATGGQAPYTYVWSSADTDNMIDGLEPGTYDVTVTDANGCTDSSSVTVDDSNSPEVTVNSSPTMCGGNNGGVSVMVTSGTAPYTYVWSNGSTASFIGGLVAGSYSVTVTDAAGCTAVGSASVEDSSNPMVSIDSDHTTCGQDNGTVTTDVSGGTAPYTYSWSNGSANVSQSGLSAGSYSVTVTDASGCTDVATATIGDSANVNADASATETTCGENNGMATVDATNGVQPYTYLWSTAATTQMIMGLEPGDYMVTVTDAAGCTDVASVLVEGSSNPSLAIGSAPEVCGMMDGAVTVSISSGIAPYTVLWSNGSTDDTQTGLEGGVYSVTVTDANGCTAVASIEVEGSITPDGGDIAVNGQISVEFCQEGTMDMLNDLSLVDEVGTNMVWIITNENGTIQHILNDAEIESFDFENQNAGTCLVYHMSYEDVTNLSVGSDVSDLTGCYDLSNSITVTKYDVSDESESSLVIDMDMCASDGNTNEPYDYSEFTANINNDDDCATLSVVGGNLYRDNPDVNGHSCTEGVNGSVAMCVSSDAGCDYNPSSDKAIKLDIEVIPAANGTTRLTELSFFEKAPINFSWLDGNSGPNNYPTKFGVRVLKGTDVVFQQSGITTLQEWNERSFTLVGDDFLVTETTTYTVELLAYCIIDNNFPVTAWDIDDLTLITECENIIEEGVLSGGPYEVCRDGLPDFITDVTLEGAEGNIVKLVLVDESDNTIVANFDDLAEFSLFDFESLPDGTCNLYAISAGVGFTGCDVGNTLKVDFEGCYKLSNAVTITKMACGTIIGTYPNPTNSIVTLSNIHTIEGDKTISIYDAMGRLVKSYKVSSDIANDDIDLSEYNSGLYTIQIISTSGQKTMKTVLKVK